jgi:hypothetical protein
MTANRMVDLPPVRVRCDNVLASGHPSHDVSVDINHSSPRKILLRLHEARVAFLQQFARKVDGHLNRAPAFYQLVTKQTVTNTLVLVHVESDQVLQL